MGALDLFKPSGEKLRQLLARAKDAFPKKVSVSYVFAVAALLISIISLNRSCESLDISRKNHRLFTKDFETRNRPCIALKKCEIVTYEGLQVPPKLKLAFRSTQEALVTEYTVTCRIDGEERKLKPTEPPSSIGGVPDTVTVLHYGLEVSDLGKPIGLWVKITYKARDIEEKEWECERFEKYEPPTGEWFRIDEERYNEL